MREIILDTETTGLDPANGDRIVEIAALEITNQIGTGSVFHHYINPERAVPTEAEKIHGLTTAFLADKPTIAGILPDFLAFIGDAPLIIHNAEFDLKFLNAELARANLPALGKARVIDTLELARRRHPGAQNSLDALCARYGIDTSRRKFHGALLDCELLAEVYAELLGGRQKSLDVGAGVNLGAALETGASAPRKARAVAPPTQEELHAHAAFVATLTQPALWLKYQDGAAH